MHARPHPLSRRPRQRRFPALAASILAPLLASCASPGPPRPPSLHLPQIVTDLSAQRIGPAVHLRWTTPSRTTDRINVLEPMTAELCRESPPQLDPPKPAGQAATPATPPQTVPGCDIAVHLTVKPGESEADDQLPDTLSSGAARLIRYRIRVLNPQGHSAGYSQGTMAPAGAAPAPVAFLKVNATRTGALLQWQPHEPTAASGSSWVELDRTRPTAPKPKAAPKKKTALSMPEDDPAEIHLRAGDERPEAPDPGGTLDRNARRGESYRYTAQRVRAVTLDGHRYDLRSPVSAPVELAMTDRFPPPAPSGLAAIPDAETGTPSIDLSWQPSAETDVAGYNVYRREKTEGAEGSSAEFKRITPTTVLGPAFSDTEVTPGHAYTYRVTAVDGTGNEGPPSGETTETAREAKKP